MKPIHVLVGVVLLAACGGSPPEGVYACMQATIARDCPAGWVCRPDHFCWRTAGDAGPPDSGPGPDSAVVHDAGFDAGLDAMSPVDGGSDAPLLDAPICSVETCDGTDNDCDGLIDEDLAVVGSPIATGSGAGFSSVSLAPIPGGYGVVYAASGASVTTGGLLQYLRLNMAGSPLGSSVTLGTDVTSRAVTQVSDSGHVFLAGAPQHLNGSLGNVYSPYYAFAYAAADGSHESPASVAYQYADANPSGRIAIVDYATGRATTYAQFGATVRRHRLTVGGGAISVLSSFDVGAPSVWAALAAGARDIVVGSTPSGLVLFYSARGDAGTSATMTGPVSGLPVDALGVAVAIGDQAHDVSAANPIGVVLVRNAPNGMVFVQASGVSPIALGAPLVLPGSIGTFGRAVVIAATPGTGGAHFFVAALDTSVAGATTQTLRVWEVTGEPPAARAISIVDDWVATRTGIAITSNGSAIRLGEIDNAGNVVSRSIGCR